MIFLIFLLLMTELAQADVYITTASNGVVYDVSNAPDCVVPAGYTRVDVKNLTMATLPIVPPYQNYNYINSAFTLNTTAVQAQQAQQAAAIASQTAQQQAKASALAKLTDAISKVSTQDVLTQQELDSLLPGT